MPSAPPVWRTRMPAAVAVPIVSRGTAFCTAVVTTGKMQPIPAPTISSEKENITVPVSRCNWVSSSIPIHSSDMPSTGKIQYFPVRPMYCPASVEVDRMPTVIGMSRRPEPVGVAPWAICR